MKTKLLPHNVWLLPAVTTLTCIITPAGATEVTPAEARAIVRDARVLGMPLVYIEKQIDAVTNAP